MRLGVIAAMAVALAGCSRTTEVPSRDIGAKIPAIKTAAQQRDMSAAPKMVKDLESDDPAIRFYAIEGLERLTGETFGYVYYDEHSRRRDAVMKWRRWLDQNHR